MLAFGPSFSNLLSQTLLMPENYNRPGLTKTILITGLLAGLLDIVAASTSYTLLTGKPFINVLYYVASAVMGPAAYKGGWQVAALGLLLHFVVAYLFTLFYFMIYPKLSLLQYNRWLSAILYGVFMWTVMSFLILPLTKVPALTFTTAGVLRGIVILIVMIGLPVSISASGYYRYKSKRALSIA
jgi:hypothetical protein